MGNGVAVAVCSGVGVLVAAMVEVGNRGVAVAISVACETVTTVAVGATSGSCSGLQAARKVMANRNKDRSMRFIHKF